MTHVAAKLKTIEMALPDPFLVHLVFASLPKEFEAFEVNYNAQSEKWSMNKLMAMCAQEEERIKASRGDSLNYLQNSKKRNFQNNNSKPQGKQPQWNNGSSSKGKAPQKSNQGSADGANGQNIEVDKDTCLWCQKKGHFKRDCPGFLKHLLNKGEDLITFVDESLYLSYAKSSWWIDSGATIHVANSLQGFRTSRTLQRGERRIKVANGVEAEVEAIGELPFKVN